MRKRPNLLAGEDLPRQPQQKRSIEKRERLKKAALSIFADKGYERASIEEIAGRAKLATGGFYQHYRSKRQLLLALMDELLERLSRLQLQPGAGATDAHQGLRSLLTAAFSHDLAYLGAYRAWQEAALSDPDLERKQRQIHAWTTGRVRQVFDMLRAHPNARPGVDLATLAQAMDSFFWSLLAQAVNMKRAELQRWIDASAHLMYHAIIGDGPTKTRL